VLIIPERKRKVVGVKKSKIVATYYPKLESSGDLKIVT